jgi:hypothetical protein
MSRLQKVFIDRASHVHLQWRHHYTQVDSSLESRFHKSSVAAEFGGLPLGFWLDSYLNASSGDRFYHFDFLILGAEIFW